MAFFPSPDSVPAGYTQRMGYVGAGGYSGQRTVQTYISTVSVLTAAGSWLHDLAELNTRHDLRGADPFQVYHIFTTSLTSPDGDLPYKQGDFFVSNGALVGLAANTQYPIRAVMPNAHYYELVIERKM